MINIIRTDSLRSDLIIEKIRKNVIDNNKSKHLIIVPDRITLSYKIKILDYISQMQEDGIKVLGCNFKITSFINLAKEINESLEKVDRRKILDSQSELMLMRKIIEDNKKSLKYYKNSTNQSGFAQYALDAVKTLRNNHIEIDQNKLLNEGKDIKLMQKAHDIFLMYKKYVEEMQQNTNYVDGVSLEESLVLNYKNSEFSNYHVYIFDILSFTKMEYEIIEEIAKNSVSLNIQILDSQKENKNIYPIDVLERLKSIKDAKVVVENIKETDLNNEFRFILDHLYAFDGKGNDFSKTDRIKLVETSTKKEEVRFIASEINKLIKTKNIRYKDIACVCSNPLEYDYVIRNVFKKFEIPYFSDKKEELSTQLITKLLMTGLCAVKGGYRQADVFDFVKNCYCLLSKNKIWDFENYCLMEGTDYKTAFSTKFEKYSENDDYKFLESNAEEIRKKIMDLLSCLDIHSLNKKVVVQDYIDSINNFLEKIDVENIVKSQNEKEKSQVQINTNNQVVKKINEILSHMQNMMADYEMTLTSFYKMLESTILTIKISNIPAYIDCVYIGDTSKSRYEDKKYIFVMGADSESFPKELVESGFITRKDREYWEGIWNKNKDNEEITISPTIKRLNKDEQLLSLMILVKPSECLYLSYVKRIDNQVSYAFRFLTANMKIPVTKSYSNLDIKGYLPSSEWDVEDFAAFIGSNKNYLDSYYELKSLISSGKLRKESIKKILEYLEGNIENIKFDKLYNLNDNIPDDLIYKREKISPTTLEAFCKCPLYYYLNKVLNLEKRKIHSIRTVDSGNVFHRVMELYFSKDNYDSLIDDENFENAIEELLIQAIKDNKEAIYLLNEDFKRDYLGLKQELITTIKTLVQRMRDSKFKPYLLEKSFGKDDSDWKGLELQYDDRKFVINGEIDRIDTYQNGDVLDAIILDYKSKKNIDFDESNISTGDRLQLVLYMMAVKENLDCNIRGLFYLLKGNITVNKKDKDKRLKYKGFISLDNKNNYDDETISNYFEYTNNYKSETSNSELFPIQVKKRKLSLSDKKSTLIENGEGIEDLSNYVKEFVINIVKLMDKGYVKVSPLSMGEIKEDELPKNCNYCEFQEICHIKNQTENIRYVSNRTIIKKNKEEAE